VLALLVITWLCRHQDAMYGADHIYCIVAVRSALIDAAGNC
jgi:hypothetical protein